MDNGINPKADFAKAQALQRKQAAANDAASAAVPATVSKEVVKEVLHEKYAGFHFDLEKLDDLVDLDADGQFDEQEFTALSQSAADAASSGKLDEPKPEEFQKVADDVRAAKSKLDAAKAAAEKENLTYAKILEEQGAFLTEPQKTALKEQYAHSPAKEAVKAAQEGLAKTLEQNEHLLAYGMLTKANKSQTGAGQVLSNNEVMGLYAEVATTPFADSARSFVSTLTTMDGKVDGKLDDLDLQVLEASVIIPGAASEKATSATGDAPLWDAVLETGHAKEKPDLEGVAKAVEAGKGGKELAGKLKDLNGKLKEINDVVKGPGQKAEEFFKEARKKFTGPVAKSMASFALVSASVSGATDFAKGDWIKGFKDSATAGADVSEILAATCKAYSGSVQGELSAAAKIAGERFATIVPGLSSIAAEFSAYDNFSKGKVVAGVGDVLTAVGFTLPLAFVGTAAAPIIAPIAAGAVAVGTLLKLGSDLFDGKKEEQDAFKAEETKQLYEAIKKSSNPLDDAQATKLVSMLLDKQKGGFKAYTLNVGGSAEELQQSLLDGTDVQLQDHLEAMNPGKSFDWNESSAWFGLAELGLKPDQISKLGDAGLTHILFDDQGGPNSNLGTLERVLNARFPGNELQPVQADKTYGFLSAITSGLDPATAGSVSTSLLGLINDEAARPPADTVLQRVKNQLQTAVGSTNQVWSTAAEQALKYLS
ncbi:MAG: hypothetical protein JWM80_5939 [Cyanobacteria bacterium RYN_339]|nr:hypothetical protein [Cyanobacteria bacterium RYN_339]